MEDLQRPAVLSCLATILEAGDLAAHKNIIGSLRLVQRLWPMLTLSTPQEQLCAALAALRAAAATPTGMAAILHLNAGGGSPGALASMLTAHDERTRVSAMCVTSQLASTYASATTGVTGGGASDGMQQDDEATAALGESLVKLVGACSPSATTTPADAIANMGRSLSDELRIAALTLLEALAGVQWGASELGASEGVLELLLTGETVHTVPASELRLKHSIAAALVRWPNALDETSSKALKAYVNAGPFAVQRPREARAAAPLTL